MFVMHGLGGLGGCPPVVYRKYGLRRRAQDRKSSIITVNPEVEITHYEIVISVIRGFVFGKIFIMIKGR